MSDLFDSNVVELRPRSVKAEQKNSGDDERRDSVFRASGEVTAELTQQLEALLFVSPTPLSVDQLVAFTEHDPDDIHACLLEMMQTWAEGQRGIILERVAGGWAFRASDRCHDALQRLTRPQGDSKLTPSAIETLAIVAYLQPISRPDIAKIRGVSVDAAMTGLLERGMVEESGRSETGAILFRTTAHFERAFGMSSLDALPAIEGFGPSDDEMARMKEQLEKMAAARVE